MTGRKLTELPASEDLDPTDLVYFERGDGSRRVALSDLLAALAGLRAFGNLFMQGNTTATGISSPGTFSKVQGTTEAGLTQRMTATNNRLTRCACPKPRKYDVRAVLSIRAPGGGKTVEAALYLGGVPSPGLIAASRFQGVTPKGDRPLTLPLNALVEMPSEAWIEVWATNQSDSGALTVADLQLTATEVG